MRIQSPYRSRTAIAEEERRPDSLSEFRRPARVALESRLESLAEVQDLMGRVTAAAGVDTDTAVNVGMAVRECVVNAIKHGNALDARKRVQLSVAITDGTLDVVVADEGRGFDPETVPDPFTAENLLKPDGRGMLMMRSFMDDVAFSFPRTGGTVVRMRKRLV